MVGGGEVLQICLLIIIKLPISLAILLVANIANIIAPDLVLNMVKKLMLKSKDLADDSATNGNKFKWGNMESSSDVAFFMSLDRWSELRCQHVFPRSELCCRCHCPSLLLSLLSLSLEPHCRCRCPCQCCCCRLRIIVVVNMFSFDRVRHQTMNQLRDILKEAQVEH